MANLNVTFDDMNGAADRLANGQGEIESKLDELKALVDELIGGGYVTDKSSGAFGESYQEFNSGAREVIGGLEGMGGFLRQAAQTLGDADEQLASGIRGA